MEAMKLLIIHTKLIHHTRRKPTSQFAMVSGILFPTGSQPWLETLVYVSDQERRHFEFFMQMNVFHDEKDEEVDEHARIEQLHKMRNFLAQFVNSSYNVRSISAAADVFKYYVKHYNDSCGDIIKATLGKASEAAHEKRTKDTDNFLSR
jgi:hypothetical protein